MRGLRDGGRDQEGKFGVRSRSPSLHEEDQRSGYIKADVEGGFMGTCGELGVKGTLGWEGRMTMGLANSRVWLTAASAHFGERPDSVKSWSSRGC